MNKTTLYHSKEAVATPSNMEQVMLNGELFFKIPESNRMRPFFMSIVSDSNHWMFISSNGGLTAGRQNADKALFPYDTDDKITESAEFTGSKTILRVFKDEMLHVWEPFSIRSEGRYHITENLYKNQYGNKVLFEAINHDLGLTFKYQWNATNTFGFVKQSQLINHSNTRLQVEVLDGVQNILPYGVGSDLQNASSNLVDAYKRSELDKASGLGIFALSAIIVDKAEPSEALKANIVWSLGIKDPKYLLSSLQLSQFRQGKELTEEVDVKAEKGAYFINTKCLLDSEAQKEWMFVAEVNQNHSKIVKLIHRIQHESDLYHKVQQKIASSTKRLMRLNAAADGLQLTADLLRDTRHFSNVLFNNMRGGIFDANYQIERWDFCAYITKANCLVAEEMAVVLDALPERFSLGDLHAIAFAQNHAGFKRLCLEYLPLKFSRRHGDPSRPWNKFSINTTKEDGSKILDYEGNWRDIFQNWEALARSYPEFIEGMIFRFLNASTFDGYNPYRVTKDGFDWETIEPDDPWSYIGYWGDHQIIYLLKFLELLEQHKPGRLTFYFDQDLFVYANVPYKIKPYQAVVANPKDTIVFDIDADAQIREERQRLGADGALLKTNTGQLVEVNFIEKLVATTLAKISNFIPGAGIWMNTQRPEWNDANNALVGNGVSMVTLYYLRRFLKFFEGVLERANVESVMISELLSECFNTILDVLIHYKYTVSKSINDTERKQIQEALGVAASLYRTAIYENGFTGTKKALLLRDLQRFIAISLQHIEHTITCNKRDDDLYHAYNLMTVSSSSNEMHIAYLSEMLEGQVAVLSSGYLSSQEALSVLDAMKASALFRSDQYSYLLYPNKPLKGFLERNTIPESLINTSKLLEKLIVDEHKEIIEKDINGSCHFNGSFKNAKDLQQALEALKHTDYASLLIEETSLVLDIFETVFNHKAFTGRSGTFYGYEGLGSIYWHMVSKLLLAVQECCLKAINQNAEAQLIGRLLEHYYEINEGIGVHKSPKLYGAFPTDPYSHTPAGKGAQQPGMTGQVKEDILSRFGELGIFVFQGRIVFNPCLLRQSEFLKTPKIFNYINLKQEAQSIEVLENSLCFTYCQIPILYHLSEDYGIHVFYENGNEKRVEGLVLDVVTSKAVFERMGHIKAIHVNIKPAFLK